MQLRETFLVGLFFSIRTYHEIITGRNGVMGFDIRYQRFVKGTGEKNGRRFGLKEGFFPLNHEAYTYGFCWPKVEIFFRSVDFQVTRKKIIDWTLYLLNAFIIIYSNLLCILHNVLCKKKENNEISYTNVIRGRRRLLGYKTIDKEGVKIYGKGNSCGKDAFYQREVTT